MMTRLTSDVEALGKCFQRGDGIVKRFIFNFSNCHFHVYHAVATALMVVLMIQLPESWFILQHQYRLSNYTAEKELSDSTRSTEKIGIGVVQLFRHRKIQLRVFRCAINAT